MEERAHHRRPPYVDKRVARGSSSYAHMSNVFVVNRFFAGTPSTCMTPITLGANTLSKGRDQGGRGSKTVDAASARARSPAGVDRGRRRFRPILPGFVPSLQRHSFQ